MCTDHLTTFDFPLRAPNFFPWTDDLELELESASSSPDGSSRTLVRRNPILANAAVSASGPNCKPATRLLHPANRYTRHNASPDTTPGLRSALPPRPRNPHPPPHAPPLNDLSTASHCSSVVSLLAAPCRLRPHDPAPERPPARKAPSPAHPLLHVPPALDAPHPLPPAQ